MNGQYTAEVLALRVLGWLASRPEMMGEFLTMSGADQGQLASLARDPGFLGALLDFLLEADARVIACCDDLQLPYPSIAEARAALPGGQLPHWT